MRCVQIYYRILSKVVFLRDYTRHSQANVNPLPADIALKQQ